MAEPSQTKTKTLEEMGWECAEMIADMLDGQDRTMAKKMVRQQKEIAGFKESE